MCPKQDVPGIERRPTEGTPETEDAGRQRNEAEAGPSGITSSAVEGRGVSRHRVPFGNKQGNLLLITNTNSLNNSLKKNKYRGERETGNCANKLLSINENTGGRFVPIPC